MDLSDLFGWRPESSEPAREKGSVRPTETRYAPAPTAPFGDIVDETGRPRLPGTGEQDALVLSVNLGRLRRRDPGFDPVELAHRAADAAVAVERAWTTLDPQPSRAVLAPALWASHRARMELYSLHGRRNVIDGMVVHSARIVAVEEEAGRDRVTVRILASSTDYDVDAQGAVVRGDTTVRQWQEDWTLERSSTASSREDGGLLAQRCPACGAPLTLDSDGLCSYCHAVPTDATRDWVVTAVTDVGREEDMLRAVLGVRTHVRLGPDDLSPTDDVVAVGVPVATPVATEDVLAPLRLRDPDVSVTAVTAAAHAAFTAVRGAWRAMDPAPARPVMTEAGIEALAGAIDELRRRGLTRAADDPDVDSVTLLRATSESEWDVVAVRVAAVFVDADVDATGAPVRGDLVAHPWVSDIVLRRRVPLPGGDVSRCPRCGAPLRASISGVCDFCREAVAGGGGEWVLDAVPQPVAAPPPGTPTAATATDAPVAVAEQTPRDRALAVLRARDPALNEAELLARARECFFAVEQAVVRRDLTGLDGLATASFLDARRTELDALRAAGRHRVLAFLDVADARLVDAADADGALRATVRIEVTGEDCIVDDRTGAAVEGTTAQRRWQEDWALTRSGDAPWLVDAVAPVTAGAGGGVTSTA